MEIDNNSTVNQNIKSLLDILAEAEKQNAADVFIIEGEDIAFRINGKIVRQGYGRFKEDIIQGYAIELYHMADNRNISLLEKGDDIFVVRYNKECGFRVSAFKQQGRISIVLRKIRYEISDTFEEIPECIADISKYKRGLVIIAGERGSGITTTAAYIINRINHSRNCYIVTIGEQTEFLHKPDKSIISQRIIRSDSEKDLNAYYTALKASADVICTDEIRNAEKAEALIELAEAGCLVIAELHAIGAANTINKLIDMFPPENRHQVSARLSKVLECIVSQQLIFKEDETAAAAFEFMRADSNVKKLIHDDKINQLESVINSDSRMISMDSSIFELFRMGKIDMETALNYAVNKEAMERNMR